MVVLGPQPRLREAATKHGWNYVDGISEQFGGPGFGHGFSAGSEPAGSTRPRTPLLVQGSLTPSSDDDPLRLPGQPPFPNTYYDAPLDKFQLDVALAALIVQGPLIIPALELLLLTRNPVLVALAFPTLAPTFALAYGSLVNMKDTTGTVHPNRLGHEAYARQHRR